MVFVEWAGLEVIIIFSGELARYETAAFTCAISIVIVFYNLPQALSNTVMSYVGASVGEKNIENGKTYLTACVIWAIIGAAIMELTYMILLPDMARFVMNNEETATLAITIIHLYMIALPFDFMQYTLGSGLRATGKEKTGFIILVVAIYAIAIPLSYYLCFIRGGQDVGLIWGANIGLISIFAGYSVVYLFMDWQKQFDEIHAELDRSEKIIEHQNPDSTNKLEKADKQEKDSLIKHPDGTEEKV